MPSYCRTQGLLFSGSHINPHIKQNLICVCVYMLMDAHTLTLSFSLSLSLSHTTQVLVLGAWWQVCLASSASASLCKVDYIRLNTKIEIFCSVFKSVQPPQDETNRHALPVSVSLSLFSLSLLSLSLTHTHKHIHTHTCTNTDLTEIEICSLIMSQHARGGDAGDCGSRAKCATGKGTLFC